MALRAGIIVRGATGTYKLVDALKAPTVDKAQVLSGPRISQKWAVVKTAVGELENLALKGEYNVYQLPEIAMSPYIRALYDALGSSDKTTPVLLRRATRRLPKTISKALLSALDIFKKCGAVHTDVNPNNVFISDVDGPPPVVKLGDLGMTLKEGFNKQRLQSLPCRAPEVWQDIGCFHASDVWSVGVTLAHWLNGKPILGADDKIIENHTEAWCIAKLQRLVGPLGPRIGHQPYKDEFELAEQLASMEIDPSLGKLITVGTLRQELQSLSDPSVSSELLDRLFARRGYGGKAHGLGCTAASVPTA